MAESAIKPVCIPIRQSVDFINVSYGERVYKVESDYCTNYLEDCPVCDNTKKIRIRGFEFKCPYCGFSSSRPDMILLSLSAYQVYEYYVCEFTVSGDIPVCVFGGKTNNSPDISSELMQRGAMIQSAKILRSIAGEGGLIPNETLNLRSNFWDRDPLDNALLREPENYYWHDKEAADSVCRVLHERQKKDLEKFNKAHSANFEYPFKEFI